MKNSTLVIGASLKSERYANKAIHKLKEKGIKVHAIGLREGDVAGVSITREKTIFEDVDTVTLYINPMLQESYYDYIISLTPRRVIFNPGTENKLFMELLEKNNIYAEIACTLVLLATNQY